MKLRIILLLVVALIGGCSKTGTPPGANPNNPPVNSHKDPKNPKVPNGPVIKNGLVVPKQPINPNCQLKGSYASAVSLTDFTRMQDYLPGAALNMPYNYNSKLDAPVNTEGKFIYENCG